MTESGAKADWQLAAPGIVTGNGTIWADYPPSAFERQLSEALVPSGSVLFDRRRPKTSASCWLYRYWSCVVFDQI
jgi:hypothetical protein